MNRGWARTLALASLLPLTASLGCDALTVNSFAGTVSEMTFNSTGLTATTIPTGQHLELWARTQYNDIVRVSGYYNLQKGLSAFGLMLRPAITLDDPCMIDGYYFANKKNDPTAGNLLTSPDAYPATVTAGGVTQTNDDQAEQINRFIHQVTDNPTITTGGPLLAVLPYDNTTEPAVPATATPADRRAACDAYIGDPNHPNTYVPNPFQLTAPLHGFVYGFVEFTTTVPVAAYNGFRIDSPLNLKGVQEIFFTVENDTVDPQNRGPLFLTSQLTQGGRDIVHFDLVDAVPLGPHTGSAALEVDLDEDPVQF
jgi:hypothetical protein